MRGLVILAHPSEQSFNHAVCDRVVNRLKSEGHQVDFHDLYAEGFDPKLTAADMTKDLPQELSGYADHLASAEALVIIHPNWWGQPPAMLKGWVDRNFRAGVAYRFVDQGNGVGVPEGLLKADRAVILNSQNSPSSIQWGGTDPLEEWWRNTVLGMCGVKHVARRLFAPILTSTQEQRDGWLKEAEDLSSEVFALSEIVT